MVNATGVFADEVRRMDDPTAAPVIRPSQGVHVVLPRRFLPGDSAIMVPRTDDGRVLFAIPWYHTVVIGTTVSDRVEGMRQRALGRSVQPATCDSAHDERSSVSASR